MYHLLNITQIQKMSLTRETLAKEIWILGSSLKAYINGNISAYYTQQMPNQNLLFKIYYVGPDQTTSALSAEITKEGYIYNPIFFPNMLTILFDWINRIGYDKERQITRTNIFKQELLEVAYKNHTICDIL